MPDRNLSISRVALNLIRRSTGILPTRRCRPRTRVFPEHPINKLTKEQLDIILYGENFERTKYPTRYGMVREHSEGWEGVVPRMERLYRETQSEYSRQETERYMSLSRVWSATANGSSPKLWPAPSEIKISGRQRPARFQNTGVG